MTPPLPDCWSCRGTGKVGIGGEEPHLRGSAYCECVFRDEPTAEERSDELRRLEHLQHFCLP